ncbi:TPA: hypothetical protein DCX16_02020 [bacterium]|nr:hypothetical protein [bacterium]
MPYRSVKELPEGVKALPVEGQELWMKAFNSAFENWDKDKTDFSQESYAFAVAWAAIKKKYRQKPDGSWVLIKEDTKEWEEDILKIDNEKRLVYGIVYTPNKVDVDGDFADADTILEAAHNFLLNHRALKSMHTEAISKEDAGIAESYIVPEDISIGGNKVKKGTWILVIKIFNDALWEAIKKGKYKGYSFGGRALREEM